MIVRPVIAILLTYVLGSPLFDGMRPAFADRPLVRIYSQVTYSIRDTAHYVAGLNPAAEPVDIMNAVLKPHG